MSADTRYMFDEATEEEARLRDQSVVLDPLTEQVLLCAGVSPGMRVLDLGTGTGAVTAIAAVICRNVLMHVPAVGDRVALRDSSSGIDGTHP